MPKLFKKSKKKKSMDETQTPVEGASTPVAPLQVFIDQDGLFLRVEQGGVILPENVAYELYQETVEKGGSDAPSQEAVDPEKKNEDVPAADAAPAVDAGTPEASSTTCTFCGGSGLLDQNTECKACGASGQVI